MGNGRQNHMFDSPKFEVIYMYFCIVLVLMECMWAKIKGDEKQLIDLEWPYTCMWHYSTYLF